MTNKVCLTEEEKEFYQAVCFYTLPKLIETRDLYYRDVELSSIPIVKKFFFFFTYETYDVIEDCHWNHRVYVQKVFKLKEISKLLHCQGDIYLDQKTISLLLRYKNV